MTRRNFKYKEQVDRLWPVLDEIARRAWEREGVSHPLKIEVDRAAGEFLKQIRNATQNLNQELPIRIENSPKGQDVDKGGWSKFAIEELVDMIGRKDVCSIADAFLKANAILRLLSGTVSSGNKHFLLSDSIN